MYIEFTAAENLDKSDITDVTPINCLKSYMLKDIWLISVNVHETLNNLSLAYILINTLCSVYIMLFGIYESSYVVFHSSLT
jgi:cytochrome c oxidase subunit IV